MRKFSSLTLICILAISPVLSSKGRAQESVTYVRRAEAAMILLKNAGIEVDITAQSFGDYPDMIDGQWYVPYMLTAIELGLLETDEETGFAFPHKSVSNAEFLMMITKTFSLTKNIPYQYTDIADGAWYSSYAGLSWRYKLLESKDNPNLLQPDLKISHKKAAEAIFKLLTAEPSLQPKPNMFPVKNKLAAPVDTRASLFESVKVTSIQTYTGITSPKTVKNALINLIRSRVNLAEQTRNDLIHAVNEERAIYKLTPIKSNYYLEVSAQRHAKDMAERGYFSHYTPEGLSYVDRIRGGGYLDVNPESCSCAQQFDLGGGGSLVGDQGPDFILTGQQECSCEPSFSLGENLAKGQLSVKQVVADWMNSPNHRRNILRPEFEEIGIGLYEDLWVQNFGRLQFE